MQAASQPVVWNLPLAPRMTLLDQIAMASSAILILALLALVVSAAVSVAPVVLQLLGH
jgi:hypothetical protein